MSLYETSHIDGLIVLLCASAVILWKFLLRFSWFASHQWFWYCSLLWAVWAASKQWGTGWSPAPRSATLPGCLYCPPPAGEQLQLAIWKSQFSLRTESYWSLLTILSLILKSATLPGCLDWRGGLPPTSRESTAMKNSVQLVPRIIGPFLSAMK